MTESAKPREPFRVRCGDCEHEWVAAYLPMALEKWCRVIGSVHCPACGAPPDRVFIPTGSTP